MQFFLQNKPVEVHVERYRIITRSHLREGKSFFAVPFNCTVFEPTDTKHRIQQAGLLRFFLKQQERCGIFLFLIVISTNHD